jgi:hypothetical protein
MKNLLYSFLYIHDGDMMIDEIEKASEVYPPDDYIDYFSRKITVFCNDVYCTKTVEEKLEIIKNLEDIIESLEETPDKLPFEAALYYIKCRRGKR